MAARRQRLAAAEKLQRVAYGIVVERRGGRETADAGRELRTVAGALEARTSGKAAGALEGYAALFNTEAVIGNYFRETIARGAFAEAIGRDDVRALFNHDANFVLGRNKAGTLALREDNAGLRYRVTPPDTQFARDLVESVRRGDISQSSFAFAVELERWPAIGRDEQPLRIIQRAKLFDVSPVTYPAYEQTSVSARVDDGEDERRMDLARRELAQREQAAKDRQRTALRRRELGLREGRL
jgi:HK97 family phage prohead protease